MSELFESPIIDGELRYGNMPRAFAQSLGSEALELVVERQLDAMDEFARATAMQAMAMYITARASCAVDTQQVDSVQNELDKLIDESKAQDQPCSQVSETAAEPTHMVTPDNLPLSSVTEQPFLARFPIKKLGMYFESDAVQTLTAEQAEALARVLAVTLVSFSKRTRRSVEEIAQHTYAYFSGKSDLEIAGGDSKKADVIRAQRDQMLKKIKEKLGQDGLNTILSQVLAVDQGATEIQVAEAPKQTIVIDSPSSMSATERILAEHGIIIDSTQETDSGDPKLLLQKGIETAFGKKMLASLNALLETEADGTSPEAEDIRGKLTELMQKYAPRYFPKLDITQDEWNTLANIIGFGVNPVTISNYHKKHLARFNITKTDPTNQFVTSAAYLLHQFVTGAKAVAPAHNATSSASFTKGRSKR